MPVFAVAVAFLSARGAYAFSIPQAQVHHRAITGSSAAAIPLHSKTIFRDRVKLNLIFSEQVAEEPTEYDLILVGSGNGAMGFLCKYMETAPENAKILVLEGGKNFFFTSDITHQNSWTRSYSEGNIFQLHNARTKGNRPIICGRACTMGGGGSINYTMIHESSKWLAKHVGFDKEYWDTLKEQLNIKFERPDPASIQTPITSLILEKGLSQGFAPPIRPNPNCTKDNIPSYEDQDIDQLYQFPTQFNTFGQRTNSGVSLINFEDERILLKTKTKVTDLDFDMEGRCTKVVTSGGGYVPTTNGLVVLCAGSHSPRLLLNHKDALSNPHIGTSVNDHIAMPLGIFRPSKDLKISPKDIYGPVFATTVWKNEEGEDIVVSMDFFTGSLQKQLYMVSHLFLAFLPNFLKDPMLTNSTLFTIVKNVVRTLVSMLNLIIKLKIGEPEFVTAIIKYNGAKDGHYETTPDKKITLGWFQGDQDKEVAKEVIKKTALPFLKRLGKEEPLVSCIYNVLTKIPFNEEQVDRYVDNYADNSLLSEQHLAGGCLFGAVLEKGETKACETGLVKGTSNVHVADLSAVPLPRVSPQMTAYVVGYHVANQLTGPAK